ncbi:LGFP repeat-containing protein [Rhodococcus qingshengii]|uniref:LGFP repeat-containing protein n=1 Tax=Rhodococcus TaxID=1827 RepID=UPI001BAF0DBC|nr:trehalose corynomycolyl transferase [Rhodococcus qingshengii]MBS3694120.1 trehalose corynomycolyl transferase [Rhodococcus qingshengii]
MGLSEGAFTYPGGEDVFGVAVDYARTTRDTSGGYERKWFAPGGYEHWTGLPPTYYANCTIGGAINTRYLQIGGGNGPVGPCVSAEIAPKSNTNLTRTQDFTNGRMYWNPSSGAWEVYGNIGLKYSNDGGPSSAVGWPTSGELGTPNGQGRFNRFQNGNIYFGFPVGRSHAVHGAIFIRYGQEGWEGGRFGFPTSDEFAVGADRQVNFEHGWIKWIAATGQTITS